MYLFRPKAGSCNLLRRAIWAWVMVFAVVPSVANALCEPLPNLSETVYAVDDLLALSDDAAIAAAATKVAFRKQSLSKFGLHQNLEKIGRTSSVQDMIKYKVQLGALAQIAATGGVAKLKPFMYGAGFQRHHIIAKGLIEQVCGARPSSNADFLQRLLGNEPEDPYHGRNALSTAEAWVAVGSSFIALVLLVPAILYFKSRHDIAKARATKRHACNIQVRLQFGKTAAYVNAVDISLSGINLKNDFDLETGQRALLEIGGYSKHSTVTWNNPRYSGFKFDESFTDAEILSLLRKNNEAPVKTQHGAQLDAV